MSTLRDEIVRTLATYTEGISLTNTLEEYERLTHATVTALNRAITDALTSDDVVDKGTQAIERWEAKWAEKIRLLPEDCEVYARDVITAALDAADITKGKGNE